MIALAQPLPPDLLAWAALLPALVLALERALRPADGAAAETALRAALVL